MTRVVLLVLFLALASTVYAGVMLYEKKHGKWVRVGNVSTFESP